MPKPIVIDFDRGLSAIAVDSIPAPETWLDTMALLTWASTSAYETIVVDTIDPLEDQCTAYVCAEAGHKRLGDFKGWGDGYAALAGEWRVMLSMLEKCGKNICLLAHTVVKEAQDPTLGAYDQFIPQLQKKTWAATHRWADMIGFAAPDAAKGSDGTGAVILENRLLHTTQGTGFIAGNRWSLPAKLPLSWEALEAAMPAALISEIRSVAGEKFREKAEEYIAQAGQNCAELREILKALKEKVKG